MKFIHTGDLHIGKIVNEFSMLEDQRHILNQIIELALINEADAVIVAGDVYDRSIPPAEAVTLLDEFLTVLIDHKIPVLIVSGNHDSGERLSFANQILMEKGLHIAGSYDGSLRKVTLGDHYGDVNFYLMPFTKPGHVKQFTDQNIESYEAAAREMIRQCQPCKEVRNVMITHYFVTNSGREPELSDSETQISVGGIDHMDVSLFQLFDYTALGHIHKPQQIGENPVYYSGSPLKYSFSEVHQQKGVNLVEIKEKGDVTVIQKELRPLHDMRRIRGELAVLMSEEIYSQADREDYICAALTNEEELIDPMGTLRSVYPNMMQIILDKHSSDQSSHIEKSSQIRKKSTLELYSEFFEQVRGSELDEERKEIVIQAIEEAIGGNRT